MFHIHRWKKIDRPHGDEGFYYIFEKCVKCGKIRVVRR